MSSNRVVLYNYFRSTCSSRVRIVLALKKIPYIHQYIDLFEQQNKSAEYAEKSPTQFVPMLEIDDISLIESIPIIEYLEETRPEPALMPKNPKDRANVRMVMSLIGSGIQPLTIGSQLALFPPEQRVQRAAKVISDGFVSLEKLLIKTSGEYCVGNNLSLADVCLYSMCHGAQRYDVPVESYPTIYNLFSKLDKIKSFRDGAWYNQADCPDKLKPHQSRI